MVRKRINNILAELYFYPLTVIEAPAGYGKTTAVNDFFMEQKNKPVWISFRQMTEMSENWKKLTSGLSKLSDDRLGRLKHMDYPSNASQRSEIISILENIDFYKPAVVVFDNFECCRDRQFIQLIMQIMEEEPGNLHFVILTRDITELDFVELLAAGKCLVISQHQMKFTTEEAMEYCALRNTNLTEPEIQKVIRYTDGWISMLYLVLNGIEEKIPVGLSSTLDELIDKTLFSNISKELQNFILRLSFMDCFTLQQAKYVTGYRETNILVRELRKKNAFIYYDNGDRKFKIHPVLLDFLRSRQTFSEEESSRIYNRLGEWCLQQEELPEAYAYLARAGEAEKILSHLNSMTQRGKLCMKFEGVDEIFASVPQNILYKYPVAYLRYLFHAILNQKKKVTQDLTDRLHSIEACYLTKSDLTESERRRILAEILCVRKFTAFNRLPEMHAYNEKIAALLENNQLSVIQNKDEFTFGSPHYLYIYFRDAGSFRTIASLAQESVHVHFSNGCGMGSDSLAAAEYACETADYDRALLESRKAVYQAEVKAQWSVVICAEFTMIRAALAVGKTEMANEVIQQLRDLVKKQNSAVYSSTVQLCMGYVFSSIGMTEKIPQWLRKGDLSVLSTFFGGLGFDRLVYAKVLLAQGEYLKLEALADVFRSSFAIYQNRLGFIHIAALQAAAKSQLEGVNKAVPLLKAALQMAEEDKIILPFAECAGHLLPVFKAMNQKEQRNPFTRKVWLSCADYLEKLNGIMTRKPELTEREKEVLTLLSEGMNRNEMAQRLCISPATVKRHLENIYHKLEVEGRTAAVKMALSGGLI